MTDITAITEITNRVLEKATGYTNFQLKRWAVAFLKPDKNSGQNSGIPRKYTFDESIDIVIGGVLVTDFNFTLVEAKEILKDITQWIRSKGWTFSDLIDCPWSGGKFIVRTNFNWKELIINIRDDGKEFGLGHRFSYIAKIVNERNKDIRGNNFVDIYKLECFGKSTKMQNIVFRSINIGEMVSSLATKLVATVNN